MVEEIVSDVFLAPVNIIVHQANCQNTMGSGIAKIIREKFPSAYAEDCRTKKGDKSKLGSYSSARVIAQDNPDLKFIVNLYSQFDYGRDTKHTNYDAMDAGLRKLRDRLEFLSETHTVGIPYRIGSNLGGGDWNVVKAIIYSVFEKSKIKCFICKHPDADKEKLENTASK
jgi:O-acetyl-ADP-ribose deacetylase (regulator of RNase III)